MRVKLGACAILCLLMGVLVALSEAEQVDTGGDDRREDSRLAKVDGLLSRSRALLTRGLHQTVITSGKGSAKGGKKQKVVAVSKVRNTRGGSLFASQSVSSRAGSGKKSRKKRNRRRRRRRNRKDRDL